VSPRRAVAALTAVLAAGGCGQSPREGVRTALDRYAEAAAARDWGVLCADVLARELVAKMRRVGLRCEDVLRTGLGDARRPHLTVRNIRITGNRAVALVRITAANQAPADVQFRLVKEDDGWKVASLGTETP
jgi:hypothetical protein